MAIAGHYFFPAGLTESQLAEMAADPDPENRLVWPAQLQHLVNRFGAVNVWRIASRFLGGMPPAWAEWWSEFAAIEREVLRELG